MYEKYVYTVPASPGRHPECRAVVHRVSASGWCGGVDGETLTEPQAEMTLKGAKSAAIARLNQMLSEFGVPQRDPLHVDWRGEKPPVRPWEKREDRGFGRRCS